MPRKLQKTPLQQIDHMSRHPLQAKTLLAFEIQSLALKFK